MILFFHFISYVFASSKLIRREGILAGPNGKLVHVDVDTHGEYRLHTHEDDKKTLNNLWDRVGHDDARTVHKYSGLLSGPCGPLSVDEYERTKYAGVTDRGSKAASQSDDAEIGEAETKQGLETEKAREELEAGEEKEIKSVTNEKEEQTQDDAAELSSAKQEELTADRTTPEADAVLEDAHAEGKTDRQGDVASEDAETPDLEEDAETTESELSPSERLDEKRLDYTESAGSGPASFLEIPDEDETAEDAYKDGGDARAPLDTAPTTSSVAESDEDAEITPDGVAEDEEEQRESAVSAGRSESLTAYFRPIRYRHVTWQMCKDACRIYSCVGITIGEISDRERSRSSRHSDDMNKFSSSSTAKMRRDIEDWMQLSAGVLQQEDLHTSADGDLPFMLESSLIESSKSRSVRHKRRTHPQEGRDTSEYRTCWIHPDLQPSLHFPTSKNGDAGHAYTNPVGESAVEPMIQDNPYQRPCVTHTDPQKCPTRFCVRYYAESALLPAGQHYASHSERSDSHTEKLPSQEKAGAREEDLEENEYQQSEQKSEEQEEDFDEGQISRTENEEDRSIPAESDELGFDFEEWANSRKPSDKNKLQKMGLPLIWLIFLAVVISCLVGLYQHWRQYGMTLDRNNHEQLFQALDEQKKQKERAAAVVQIPSVEAAVDDGTSVGDIAVASGASEPSEPFLIYLTRVLYHIVFPATLLVICMFWGLIYPSKEGSFEFFPLLTHGLNFFVMLLDAAFSNQYYEPILRAFLTFLMYIFLYLVFTAILWTVHYEHPCGCVTEDKLREAREDPNVKEAHESLLVDGCRLMTQQELKGSAFHTEAYKEKGYVVWRLSRQPNLRDVLKFGHV